MTVETTIDPQTHHTIPPTEAPTAAAEEPAAHLPPTPLNIPTLNPHNVEATKYYVFNETGNILISSTIDSSQPIRKEIQDVFSEVSVFFAGMTRAITTTVNPEDKNHSTYSLYNGQALNQIIGGSGLFVNVSKEDVIHSTSSWGVTFSKELVEGVLGLATGAGELAFASAMVKSMGEEALRISGNSSTTDTKVANIIFVCEYLLGMPVVSAIVVSMDAHKHSQEVKVGPCCSERSVETVLVLSKETYLFVPPSLIKNFSGDLDSIESLPEYVELTNWLQGLILQTPKAMNVVEKTAPGEVTKVASGTALSPSKTYTIEGQFLPFDGITLKFIGGAQKATGVVTSRLGDLSSTEIGFSVSGTQADPLPIGIYQHGKLIIATPGTYTIG